MRSGTSRTRWHKPAASAPVGESHRSFDDHRQEPAPRATRISELSTLAVKPFTTSIDVFLRPRRSSRVRATAAQLTGQLVRSFIFDRLRHARIAPAIGSCDAHSRAGRLPLPMQPAQDDRIATQCFQLPATTLHLQGPGECLYPSKQRLVRPTGCHPSASRQDSPELGYSQGTMGVEEDLEGDIELRLAHHDRAIQKSHCTLVGPEFICAEPDQGPGLQPHDLHQVLDQLTEESLGEPQRSLKLILGFMQDVVSTRAGTESGPDSRWRRGNPW